MNCLQRHPIFFMCVGTGYVLKKRLFKYLSELLRHDAIEDEVDRRVC